MGQAKLGIDVGGTRLKMGLVAQGRVVQRAVVSMSSATVEDLVDTISTAIDALQRQSPWRVNAVGLGVAGVMSPGGQRVLESPNMPWLNGAPLATLLGERLKLPTHCDNDANCVGWGEAIAGAGAGCKDQICLALGTGVGGSLILDGQLFHGVRGRGAELGHINIDPDGPPCGCGGRGCLEQYASKTGLLRMLDDYGLGSTDEDPVVALFEQARQGEASATAIVSSAGEALGQALANLRRLFGVRTAVLAGGISGAADLLTPHLHSRAARLGVTDLDVRVGTLDTDAGIIGAAELGADL